jgi:hypothetical protein
MSDQSFEQILPASDLNMINDNDNLPDMSDDDDDVDSLPSTSATSTDISASDQEWQSDAEREWKESLQQLELLLTMVLVPYVGKYFGRKAAYWGEFWNKDMRRDETMTSVYSRLGQIHGMAISRQDRNDQSGPFQRNRCCRGRCFLVIVS